VGSVTGCWTEIGDWAKESSVDPRKAYRGMLGRVWTTGHRGGELGEGYGGILGMGAVVEVLGLTYWKHIIVCEMLDAAAPCLGPKHTIPSQSMHFVPCPSSLHGTTAPCDLKPFQSTPPMVLAS